MILQRCEMDHFLCIWCMASAGRPRGVEQQDQVGLPGSDPDQGGPPDPSADAARPPHVGSARRGGSQPQSRPHLCHFPGAYLLCNVIFLRFT